LERWKNGRLEWWKIGRLEWWKIGRLECWMTGKLNVEALAEIPLRREKIGRLECWKFQTSWPLADQNVAKPKFANKYSEFSKSNNNWDNFSEFRTLRGGVLNLVLYFSFHFFSNTLSWKRFLKNFVIKEISQSLRSIEMTEALAGWLGGEKRTLRVRFSPPQSLTKHCCHFDRREKSNFDLLFEK
jgi:hypothetical protein